MIRNLQRIYEHLQDELSKEIYMDRLGYSMSGSEKRFIDQILDRTVRISPSWEKLQDTMQKAATSEMVLFGSGIWGDTVLTEFKDIPWKCIIDNSPKQAEKGGIPIVLAKDFFDGYQNEIIVISSFKNGKAMIGQCIENGVPQSNIIDVGSVIYELTEGLIYFDDEIITHMKEGTFIDGGCFDGSDAKRFIDKYHGYAICFEPDSHSLEMISSQLKGYEQNYRVVPKALWKEEGEVSFVSNGSPGSRIKEGDMGETIPTTAIDLVASDDKIAMIKMDIEGAELEALKGAESTIKREHPILAVSIYHKPEDIITLPEYILDIREGYRLFLRHYSFSWYDTVLYAIPEDL